MLDHKFTIIFDANIYDELIKSNSLKKADLNRYRILSIYDVSVELSKAERERSVKLLEKYHEFNDREDAIFSFAGNEYGKGFGDLNDQSAGGRFCTLEEVEFYNKHEMQLGEVDPRLLWVAKTIRHAIIVTNDKILRKTAEKLSLIAISFNSETTFIEQLNTLIGNNYAQS